MNLSSLERQVQAKLNAYREEFAEFRRRRIGEAVELAGGQEEEGGIVADAVDLALAAGVPAVMVTVGLVAAIILWMWWRRAELFSSEAAAQPGGADVEAARVPEGSALDQPPSAVEPPPVHPSTEEDGDASSVPASPPNPPQQASPRVTPDRSQEVSILVEDSTMYETAEESHASMVGRLTSGLSRLAGFFSSLARPAEEPRDEERRADEQGDEDVDRGRLVGRLLRDAPFSSESCAELDKQVSTFLERQRVKRSNDGGQPDEQGEEENSPVDHVEDAAVADSGAVVGPSSPETPPSVVADAQVAEGSDKGKSPKRFSASKKFAKMCKKLRFAKSPQKPRLPQVPEEEPEVRDQQPDAWSVSMEEMSLEASRERNRSAAYRSIVENLPPTARAALEGLSPVAPPPGSSPLPSSSALISSTPVPQPLSRPPGTVEDQPTTKSTGVVEDDSSAPQLPPEGEERGEDAAAVADEVHDEGVKKPVTHFSQSRSSSSASGLSDNMLWNDYRVPKRQEEDSEDESVWKPPIPCHPPTYEAQTLLTAIHPTPPIVYLEEDWVTPPELEDLGDLEDLNDLARGVGGEGGAVQTGGNLMSRGHSGGACSGLGTSSHPITSATATGLAQACSLVGGMATLALKSMGAGASTGGLLTTPLPASSLAGGQDKMGAEEDQSCDAQDVDASGTSEVSQYHSSAGPCHVEDRVEDVQAVAAAGPPTVLEEAVVDRSMGESGRGSGLAPQLVPGELEDQSMGVGSGQRGHSPTGAMKVVESGNPVASELAVGSSSLDGFHKDLRKGSPVPAKASSMAAVNSGSSSKETSMSIQDSAAEDEEGGAKSEELGLEPSRREAAIQASLSLSESVERAPQQGSLENMLGSRSGSSSGGEMDRTEEEVMVPLPPKMPKSKEVPKPKEEKPATTRSGRRVVKPERYRSQ